MIPSLLVKAEVVDIRNRKSNLPKRVVADANVLCVINYDFTGLAASGGRVEPRRSLRRGAVSVVIRPWRSAPRWCRFALHDLGQPG